VLSLHRVKCSFGKQCESRGANLGTFLMPGGGAHMKIYVGNLSYSTSDSDVRTAFSAFGNVETADVILDRSTGRSKGFGFVEMPDAAEAKAAIDGLNGKDLDGRALNVNEAKPRTDRPQRY
jgi:RNA recognition motif-containing protein